MMLLLTRLLGCLAMYALGSGRGALSSLNPARNAASRSIGHLEGGEQAGSIDDVVKDAPTDQLPRLNQAERKAEVASMEDINKEIKRRIQSLNPESNRDFSEIKSNLKQLHDILRLPILDKVLELSGLGGSMSALGRHSRSVVQTGSQENSVSWLDKGRSWIDILYSYLKKLGFPNKSLPVTGDELPQDILDTIKKIIMKERIQRWNYLEKVLLEFQAEDDRYTGSDFKLPFLESTYLLGQLIYRHNLLPPDSIKEITIFEPTTLLKMIEYHVELLFSRGKGEFFDIPESVIPELEFLTTGNAIKHFHWPIKALSAQDQKHAVYLVLKIIMRHAPWFSSGHDDWGVSPGFEGIRADFTRDGFLENADRLSSAISDDVRNVDLGNDENIRILIMIEQVLIYLDHCPYYQPIIQAADSRTRILSSTQFDFIRSYLKFFRNRFKDPSYWPTQKREDLAFLRTTRDPSHETKDFLQWTDIVTAGELGHQVFVRPKSRLPNLTPWMGQKCCICGGPFRECKPPCRSSNPLIAG
ncbi:hypothetical protein H4Q26_002516 [Puccinia striiformis f. sp. tritici PST-130]|nr:hypothetical protein H4Q26_002516 [Puccinia striiformis f. sp. tritici PST-130]